MKRLQTFGLIVTLVLVGALVVSAVAGILPWGPGPAPDATRQRPSIEGERVRVEVLNGAGVSGLARDVTRFLRQQGFDVVYFGNAPGGPRDTSEVIDRVGRPDAAQQVADVLGIAQVRFEPDTALYLEVTVILGRDRADEGP